MKLIHLSDLHIGKRVNDVPMLDDQKYILSQILRVIDRETPDGVLICGDVYDKSIPPAEAVTVFDDFLYSLSRRKIPCFIISGNHDSAERLAFGGRLMESTGIYLSPLYDGTLRPVTLTDENGPVDIWLLPFLKPIHVRRFFPDAGIESYTDACRVAVESMPLDLTRRNVLLTHQFVTGASRCDSEELSVGGTDNVDAALFRDFDYVALGHIHGPQNMAANIRYCGSPLKYSFSEAGHDKGITLVELPDKGSLSIRHISLTPLRDMRRIRGSYEEVTAKSFWEGTATEDYLHITLTDEEDVPEAVGKLRVIYPNLMQLSYDNTRTRKDSRVGSAGDIKKKTPMELFGELYDEQNGQPMTPVQQTFVGKLLESIQEESL